MEYSYKILIIFLSGVFCSCSFVSKSQFEKHVRNTNDEIMLVKENIHQNDINEEKLQQIINEYETLILQQNVQNKELNSVKMEFEKIIGKYEHLDSQIDSINYQLIDIIKQYDTLATQLDSTNYKMLVELTTILQSRINEVSK